MNPRHESKENYIRHLLECVGESIAMIEELERTAKRLPNLADECADRITENKYNLTQYREKLREAYALPDQEA